MLAIKRAFDEYFATYGGTERVDFVGSSTKGVLENSDLAFEAEVQRRFS